MRSVRELLIEIASNLVIFFFALALVVTLGELQREQERRGEAASGGAALARRLTRWKE